MWEYLFLIAKKVYIYISIKKKKQIFNLIKKILKYQYNEIMKNVIKLWMSKIVQKFFPEIHI